MFVFIFMEIGAINMNIDIMGKEIKIVKKKLDDLYGYFDIDKNTIYVSNKLKGDDLHKTILHEALHGCLGYSGLNELLMEGLEESLVRCIEYNYIDIVKDYYDKK